MITLLAEFFAIIGLNVIPPQNFAELLPYLFTVLLGFALIGAIFSVFRSLVKLIMSGGARY